MTALENVSKLDDGVLVQHFLASASVAFGIPLLLYGYRSYRASLLLCSFIYGGILGYCIVTLADVDVASKGFVAWTTLMSSGFLFSLIYLVFIKFGIYVCGASAFSLFGIFIQTIIHTASKQNSNTIGSIVVLIFGLIGGILNFRFTRALSIISLAWTGAFILTWGMGHFAGQYPQGLDLSSTKENLPMEYYAIYIPITMILAIAGGMMQFKYTADGLDDNLIKSDSTTPQDSTHDAFDINSKDRIPSLKISNK